MPHHDRVPTEISVKNILMNRFNHCNSDMDFKRHQQMLASQNRSSNKYKRQQNESASPQARVAWQDQHIPTNIHKAQLQNQRLQFEVISDSMGASTPLSHRKVTDGYKADPLRRSDSPSKSPGGSRDTRNQSPTRDFARVTKGNHLLPLQQNYASKETSHPSYINTNQHEAKDNNYQEQASYIDSQYSNSQSKLAVVENRFDHLDEMRLKQEIQSSQKKSK